MSVQQRFDRALAGAPPAGDDAYRADRIVTAAARALDAAGASMSIAVGDLRVPIGASDTTAARAESLQFSVGEGPCLTTLSTGEETDAPADVLGRRWPGLTDAWHRDTPYRSATSVPVRLQGAMGALNVYLSHTDGGARFAPGELGLVGQLVTQRARADLHAAPDTLETTRRTLVWVALGMIRERWGLGTQDALQRLRDHATRDGRTLDEIAHDVAARTLSTEEFKG